MKKEDEAQKSNGEPKAGHAEWQRLVKHARWAAVSTSASSGGMPSSGLAAFCAIQDNSGRVRLALPISALESQANRLVEDGRVCLLIVDQSTEAMPLRALVEGRAKIVAGDSEESKLAQARAAAKFSKTITTQEECWAIVTPWSVTVWEGNQRVASLDVEQLALGDSAEHGASLTELKVLKVSEEQGLPKPRS